MSNATAEIPLAGTGAGQAVPYQDIDRFIGRWACAHGWASNVAASSTLDWFRRDKGRIALLLRVLKNAKACFRSEDYTSALSLFQRELRW